MQHTPGTHGHEDHNAIPEIIHEFSLTDLHLLLNYRAVVYGVAY